MLKITVILSFLFISAHCSGEFTVLHAPGSVKFKGHERLPESLLKEVYSAALGQSTAQTSEWSGMYLTDPFRLADGIVTVAIDGRIDLDNGKGHSFPLSTDENEAEVFGALEARIYEQQPEALNDIILIDLSYGLESIQPYDFLKGIKHIKPDKNLFKHLKIGFLEDREFIHELFLLNAIVEKIENGALDKPPSPSVFWFKFPGYKSVVDLHGENSTAVKEARNLLSDAINRLQHAFNKLYNGDVLINILATERSRSRYARAASNGVSVSTRDEFSELNLASTYSEDYPVIFNIILWLMVALSFSLLAISIVIGDMDPGRDSIIYRMTSTRMKKEN